MLETKFNLDIFFALASVIKSDDTYSTLVTVKDIGNPFVGEKNKNCISHESILLGSSGALSF